VKSNGKGKGKASNKSVSKGKTEERLSDTPHIKMTEGEYDGAFI